MTSATCPNSAVCCAGDSPQPVYTSLQILKAELKGNVMTIAHLVESQMQPSMAECIECVNKRCASTVTTTDFRLSLPGVFPVMAGRERVGSLTPWTFAQYAACCSPYLEAYQLALQLLKLLDMLLGTVSAMHSHCKLT